MSEDFISGLQADLVEAMDRYERRSPHGRLAAGRYPQLLRPATLARVAAGAAIIVALVAAVLTVAWESDVERPAAPGEKVVPDVPSGDDADRQSVTEKGVTFSFRLPPVPISEIGDPGVGAWERFSSIPTDKSAGGPISLSKSFDGQQRAEAIIFWTSFPDGDYADPCARLLSPRVGSSAADLAAAVSTAPGTELVTGPRNVTLGGRPAKHVVLTVRRNVGCDPGFFYTWKEAPGGAFWGTTGVGDTIRVWIVDIDGTRLFIEAQTKQTAGVETLYDRQAAGDVKQEVEQIVESISFE